MLRAGVNDPQNPFVIAGLSDDNIDRLRNGQPIVAELRSFGVDLPGRLAIIHGATEHDLEAMLRGNGLIGESTRGVANPRMDQIAEARARHDKILIAMVGLPRSGKTTWARRQSYPVVSPDSIRLAMHGQRFASRAEPLVWATAKVMVRALFLAGHRHVILDATNTTEARRKEWRCDEWATFWKVIDTSADVCRSRAEGDAEILPVIDRMAAGYEPLGDDLIWP